MSKKSKKMGGMGCLLLFALPFAGGGLLMSVLCIKSLLYWNGIQGWTETPCTIVAAELEQHSDDDGVSYKATATYKYEWAGQEYECDTVGVHGGSDNLGSFQKKKGKELEKYAQNKKAFHCFVNPNDPAEAVLYRDLRPEMLAIKGVFGVLFGGVGFGLIGFGIWSTKRDKHRKQVQQLNPNEPWSYREDWLNGRIQSSQWKPVFVAIGFTLFWNLISWTVGLAFLLDDKDKPFWVMGLIALFPAIGLGMLGYTIFLIVKAKRWGGSEFELASVPGVIGGRLAGVIHAPAGLELAESFLLTLTCYEIKTRRTSDGTETYQEPQWQTDQKIIETLGGDQAVRTVVPVSFYVPYDQQPTNADAGISWKLEVKAEIPGVDYTAEFEVPVFKTAASSPDAPPADELLASYVAPVDFGASLTDIGGRLLSETPHRCEILFPRGRNWRYILPLAVFAIIGTAVCVGIQLAPGIPLAVRLLLPLMDVLVVGVCIWTWFDNTTLSFSPEDVEIQRNMLINSSHKRFEQANIKSIQAEASGTRINNKVLQQVTLITQDGTEQKLIGSIKRMSDAQTLAEKIEAMLGLKPTTEEGAFSLGIDLSKKNDD